MEPEFDVRLNADGSITVKAWMPGDHLNSILEYRIDRRQSYQVEAVNEAKRILREHLIRMHRPQATTYTYADITMRYGPPMRQVVRAEPVYYMPATETPGTIRMENGRWYWSEDSPKAFVPDIPPEELAAWDEYDQSED